MLGFMLHSPLSKEFDPARGRVTLDQPFLLVCCEPRVRVDVGTVLRRDSYLDREYLVHLLAGDASEDIVRYLPTRIAFLVYEQHPVAGARAGGGFALGHLHLS